MNKFILALLAGTFLCSNAMADCNGFYLGGRGGVVKHDYSKKGNSGINSDGLDKNKLMLSGALGYRYNYFRTEVEYVWRDKSEKKYEAIHFSDVWFCGLLKGTTKVYTGFTF